MADVVGTLRVVLQADASEFERAMKEASADVKELAGKLQKDLEPRQKAVNAAMREFLGGPEIRRAQEYAQAVQKIGGTTQLVAKDQAKVNAAMREALSHYKALGIQAPQNLMAIEKATRGAASSISGIGASLKSVAGLFGVTFSVGALVGFTKQIFSTASGIVDLSKKTGLSIEGVQRLGFVAEQSGGSVEQMADAVFKTSLRIARGSKEARQGVEGLGLSWQKIRQQKPEEQYDAIIRAAAGIEDVNKRNLLGNQAMGKSYANVAASVDDYVEALKNAPEANADAIRATDAAADAIERAWKKAENAAINSIGNIFIALEKGLQTPTGIGINAAAQATPFLGGLPIAELLGRGMKPAQSKTFGKDINLASAQTSQLQDYMKQLKVAQAEVAALTKQQRDQIKAALELGESAEEISNAMDISERSVELFKDSLKGAGKEAESYRKKIQAIALPSLALQQQVKDHADALREFGREMSNLDLFKFAMELDELQRKGAKLDPELQNLREQFMFFRDMVADTRKELELLQRVTPFTLDRDAEIGRRKSFFSDMAAAGPLPGTMGVSLENQINVKQLVKPTEDWRKALDGVVDAFEDLANISGDTMSGIARGIGSGMSATSLFHDGWKQLSKPQTFAGFLTGIGSIIGALSQAIALGKALHDALTRSEGEKAAADIRRSGFDPDLADIGEDDPLAKTIAQMVKDLGIDRNMALELNLGDIISRAGGIDAGNFEAFRNRADELFDDIALGGEVGALALKEIDEVMGLLGKHVVEVGGLWDAEFVRMIGRGRDLASVVELIKGQLDIAASGLNQSTGNVETQDSFDRLSRIALATFNAMIANGQSAAQAISAIKPSIDALKQSAAEFGLAGNDAFNQLARWSDLVGANQPLLDQVAGLNDVMTALANVGALDAQTFSDIQAEGLAAFSSLKEAGFSQNEALAQMKPMLETIKKLHKERGLAIDDETQKLITQAEQQGILAEEQQSTNDVLMDGLGAIIEALGGKIPEAWKKAADAAKQSMDGVDKESQGLARRLKDRLGDLDFTVDVGYNFDDPGVPGFEPPRFAHGGVVDQPTLAWVGEEGREWIIPDDLIKSFNSGPSLPSLSMAGSVSGVDRGAVTSGEQRAVMLVDGRVLGEVVAPSLYEATRRVGVARV